MLPGDGIDVALRLTLTDHSAELDDALTIQVEVRQLDGDWCTLLRTTRTGRGRDFLASDVEDIVHAWHYEDRRAIIREAQRNDRQARIHARKHDRLGS